MKTTNETTTIEQLIINVSNDKEIVKLIAKKLNHYTVEQFVSDAQQYIKAIREGRMINSIGSVSASGMSRTIKFLSCERYKNESNYNYRQYRAFFTALGYNQSRSNNNYFSISGCGMDMIFHTNYSIIHKLKSLGFIGDDDCRVLAQQTPTTI